MDTVFAIRGMKKGPTLRIRPFFQFFTLEAKSGVQTIYASL